MLSRIRSPKAFTLVELIITLVIIGILAGIAWISYNALQARAEIGSLTTTAEMVDHEATALAAEQNQPLGVGVAADTHVVASLNAADPAAVAGTGPWNVSSVRVHRVAVGSYSFVHSENVGSLCVLYTPSTTTPAQVNSADAFSSGTVSVDGNCVSDAAAGDNGGNGGNGGVVAAPTGLVAAPVAGGLAVSWDAVPGYSGAYEVSTDGLTWAPGASGDTVSLADGQYTVRVRAAGSANAATVDATVGAGGGSNPMVFSLIDGPPQWYESIGPVGVWAGFNVGLAGDTYDATNVTYKLDNGDWQPLPAVDCADTAGMAPCYGVTYVHADGQGGNVFSFDVSVDGLAAGDHTLQFQALPDAGHDSAGVSDVYNVNIPETPMVVSLPFGPPMVGNAEDALPTVVWSYVKVGLGGEGYDFLNSGFYSLDNGPWTPIPTTACADVVQGVDCTELGGAVRWDGTEWMADGNIAINVGEVGDYTLKFKFNPDAWHGAAGESDSFDVTVSPKPMVITMVDESPLRNAGAGPTAVWVGLTIDVGLDSYPVDNITYSLDGGPWQPLPADSCGDVGAMAPCRDTYYTNYNWPTYVAHAGMSLDVGTVGSHTLQFKAAKDAQHTADGVTQVFNITVDPSPMSVNLAYADTPPYFALNTGATAVGTVMRVGLGGDGYNTLDNAFYRVDGGAWQAWPTTDCMTNDIMAPCYAQGNPHWDGEGWVAVLEGAFDVGTVGDHTIQFKFAKDQWHSEDGLSEVYNVNVPATPMQITPEFGPPAPNPDAGDKAVNVAMLVPIGRDFGDAVYPDSNFNFRVDGGAWQDIPATSCNTNGDEAPCTWVSRIWFRDGAYVYEFQGDLLMPSEGTHTVQFRALKDPFHSANGFSDIYTVTVG